MLYVSKYEGWHYPAWVRCKCMFWKNIAHYLQCYDSFYYINIPLNTENSDSRLLPIALLSFRLHNWVLAIYETILQVISLSKPCLCFSSTCISFVLFTAVQRPREAAIDAQLLKACGSLARVHIESSQSSLPVFKPRDFGEKLVSSHDLHKLVWQHPC